MSKLLLVAMFALAACNGHPSNVSTSALPDPCLGELVAVVTNDGPYGLDVYNGESNLGTIRPGESRRFALLHGGGVTVRVPAGQMRPEGRIRSRVHYLCET